MHSRRWMVSGVLVALVLTLMVGSGPGLAESLYLSATVGTGFTYQGHLLDGGRPANGSYDLRFYLFETATGGTEFPPTVVAENTAVMDGVFTVYLDFGEGVFEGRPAYLEIGVRPGTSGGAFTQLSPRQALSAAPYALSLRPGAMVVDTHQGGDVFTGKTSASSGTGVVGSATDATGANFGVRGLTYSSNGIGVYGWAGSQSGTTYGVKGYSNSGHGVFGSTMGDWSNYSGVYGEAYMDHANGVNGVNTGGGYGVRGESTRGVGVVAKSGNGNLIEAWDTDPGDRRFYVTNGGYVYADGTFLSGGADLAEMLPAAEGLEPGEVLIIGADGELARAPGALDGRVVGVYSSEPGFVGGSDGEATAEGQIPLAIAGIVPVKASAENGAIAPGDLLVSAATPGHAMRAEAFVGGAVIGKALEPLNEGSGVIRMLVMPQ